MFINVRFHFKFQMDKNVAQHADVSRLSSRVTKRKEKKLYAKQHIVVETGTVLRISVKLACASMVAITNGSRA